VDGADGPQHLGEWWAVGTLPSTLSPSMCTLAVAARSGEMMLCFGLPKLPKIGEQTCTQFTRQHSPSMLA